MKKLIAILISVSGFYAQANVFQCAVSTSLTSNLGSAEPIGSFQIDTSKADFKKLPIGQKAEVLCSVSPLKPNQNLLSCVISSLSHTESHSSVDENSTALMLEHAESGDVYRVVCLQSR